jgi:AraC family transcriptional activator of pobA
MAADHDTPSVPDRLGDGQAVQVVLLTGEGIGGPGRIREPHRHAYHELIWIRAGQGEQRVDGTTVPVAPGTVTVIGRGQVHQFVHAEHVDGAVLRFGDELLAGGGQRIVAGWLLTGAGGTTITVPDGEQARLDALVRAIRDEAVRPPDPYAAELQRTLLASVLLLLERWYDASRSERRDAGDAAVQIHRRFTALLERDYARHHDATYYADALAMPRAALSRALTERTGRPTKELILDRVMLEAERLLRITDQSVGAIAHAVGFADQLYFSRAFKRRLDQAPSAYRDAVRGVDAGAGGTTPS